MSQIPKSIEKPKKWHSLSEIPERDREIPAQNEAAVNVGNSTNQSTKQSIIHPLLVGVSAALMKLLWDSLVYPFSSFSVRVKRLGSARAAEQGKREGYEKGLLIETTNGQTTYILLTEKGFEALNTPYPYKRDVSLQHSFRVKLLQFLLSQDPSYKKVFIEYPINQKGATADVATLRHDSGKEGWEVTISTTNVITNLLKYEKTSFVKVVLIAPDYRLKEAIKSTILGAGLSSDLLARAEFRHFSQLLHRQRKLYRY